MVYTRTNWVNDTPPPIDAINLNNMEQGLVDAHATALYARYLWGPLLPRQIASVPFAAAGRIYLAPIDVPRPVTIDRIIYQVGGVQAGNVRLGVYREGATADSSVGADLVVESASVAQAAANYIQMVTVADTILTPGQYFPAIQGDNATGTFYKSYGYPGLAIGYYNRAGGYGAFTDPCPALTGISYVLFVGLRIKENLPIMS